VKKIRENPRSVKTVFPRESAFREKDPRKPAFREEDPRRSAFCEDRVIRENPHPVKNVLSAKTRVP
jgi:hypothetical protein